MVYHVKLRKITASIKKVDNTEIKVLIKHHKTGEKVITE